MLGVASACRQFEYEIKLSTGLIKKITSIYLIPYARRNNYMELINRKAIYVQYDILQFK